MIIIIIIPNANRSCLAEHLLLWRLLAVVDSVTYILYYGEFRVTMRCAVGTSPALPQGTPNPPGTIPLADFMRSRSGLGTESKALSSPSPLPPPRDSFRGIQSKQARIKSKRCRPSATGLRETLLQMIRRLVCHDAAPLCLLTYNRCLIFAQAVLQPLSGGGGGCRASDERLNGISGDYKRVGGTGSGRCRQGTVF